LTQNGKKKKGEKQCKDASAKITSAEKGSAGPVPEKSMIFISNRQKRKGKEKKL